MIRKILCSLFLVLMLSPAYAFQEKSFTAEQWIEDLNFIVSNLQAIHPNLYAKVSKEEFKKAVESARASISGAASDIESYLAIRRVVAKIRDGHTEFGFEGALDLQSSRFPIKLDYFSDGYFVSAIPAEKRDLLGARVIAIDDIPIEEVMAKAMEITNVDNLFGRRNRALQLISNPVILQGLGCIDDAGSMTLLLRSNDDSTFEHTCAAIAPSSEGDLFTVQAELGDKTPLHLKNPKQNYWFEHLSKDKTVYFQFNLSMDQGGGAETFTKFTERLWSFIDDHRDSVEKLIIDLRYNPGGSGQIAIPFLKEIIKRDWIDNKNSLFVLLGKGTYSGAVIFAKQLLQYTDAVFVGDPPGCPPNFFAINRTPGNLPNSGFGLSVATRQIDDYWWANREFFSPNIPAPFSGRDYFSGRDPALDLVLSGKVRTLDEIAAEEGAEAAIAYHEKIMKQYPDLTWWSSSQNLEPGINLKGYRLLQAGAAEKAKELFVLNTRLFPESWNAWDSLAELYFISGEYDLAYDNYKKSFEIDGFNEVHVRYVVNGINTTAAALIENDEQEQASQAFELGTRLFPKSSECWKKLGDLYFSMEQYEKSLACLKKAHELNPGDTDIKEMVSHLEKKIEKK